MKAKAKTAKVKPAVRTCAFCSKEFTPKTKRSRFCCKKCCSDYWHRKRNEHYKKRKFSARKSRAVFLARRDLEAREAERAVPVRVSFAASGMRIVSRGNCSGGGTTGLPHI